MFTNSRNWNTIFNKERDINSSKETIRYFEKTNDNSLKKNIESSKKIEELENIKYQLIADFEDKYKISFENAIELVNNSDNANREFHLEEYNEIIKIIDEIDGEKFYIYQRNKSIKQNKEYIDIINKSIEKKENSNT